MKTRLFSIFLLIFALGLPAATLSGCASGTNPFSSALLTADTFSKKLAVAYTAVTEIRQSATALLNANRITADDGTNVLQTTDAARAGLDVARALSATDLTSADAKLTATRTILDGLRAYLLAKGGA